MTAICTKHGEGAQFLKCIGGKSGLALNMTTLDGGEVMRMMLARADGILESIIGKILNGKGAHVKLHLSALR